MKPHLVAAMVFFTALIGGCASSPPPRNPDLAAQLYPVLNRLAHTGAICSARVVELSSGRELYAQDIDRPMLPASNLKLLTTAAALDRFGPDQTLKTYLAYDGANLWVIGTGDPATGDPRIAAADGGTPLTLFDRWAQALRQRGITRIPGNLYYYDGVLDDEWVHPSWEKASLAQWYSAPVSGLNFNDNCIDLSLTPTLHGQPVRYELMPPVRNHRLVNNCFSSTVHAPTIARAPRGNLITLAGTCAQPTAAASVPAVNPGFLFADALYTRLGAHGLWVHGQIVRASSPLGSALAPPPHMLIAVHETPVRDILFRANKYSQNLFAEALMKSLGRQYELDQGRNIRGSWPAGSNAVHAFLQRHQIDTAPIIIADGSGLSRYNLATTRALTDLLAVMAAHPHAEVFRGSLAAPGQPGTLARRMDDLQGNVLAKTGTLRDASCLSGYVRTRHGQWLGFSILYNRFNGDEKPYQELQDEACRILAGWEP